MSSIIGGSNIHTDTEIEDDVLEKKKHDSPLRGKSLAKDRFDHKACR